ncbi:hypothetical protein [Ahrensia sp. R2A130]|uniref:hypothetical protein n=1 Tax=Ahrensia sp. R2A130 TaxID=744979 RepID=UPI0001E0B4BF|nr:hypothetical protein [Ahrensia sp. R2A130]EFL88697.1 hypothetical protein R2A130_1180 [Ahrensia sp. R2A130]
MSDHHDNKDDEPLDPKVEIIRQKLVRLLMVSGGIMLLGFLAVFGAIVYKINSASDVAIAIAPDEARTIAVPQGSQWLGTAPAGNGLLVTLKLADGTTIIQRHDANGTVIARWRLESAD